MKNYSSLFILLFIILILVGILFLRQSGILTINHKSSTNENSSNFLNTYYDKVNPNDQPLPNVKDAVNSMQTTKH